LHLVVGCLHDQVIDDAVGFVDVMQGAVAQAARGGIVFFARDVVVSFIEQFHGAVKAAGAVHAGIDWRMIVQVLAVVDRGALDLIDGFVDLFNGVLFLFIHVMRWSEVLKMGAGVAQVGEGVQVGWMPSRFVGESNGGAQSDKKYDYGATSCSFHGLLEGLSAE
jgi:hypothetical protein